MHLFPGQGRCSALLLPMLIWLACLNVAVAHYTNQWAVEIHDSSRVDQVAEEMNCVNEGPILDDVYLFSHRHVSKRSVDPHADVHSQLESHPHVVWTEQQKVLSRKKRAAGPQLWSMGPRPGGRRPGIPPPPPPSHYEDFVHLNDQRWPQMWYLNRGNRLDMNVQDAWLEGATGKGVSITILDDGIERLHPDLIANYDPLASFDVNDNDNDPTPRYDLTDSNRHGTRCAGEVAATANNSECAVGIAYEAGIGGVRMLDGDVTDAVEARSLRLNYQHVDIYSASWGPDDDGKTVDGPGRLASRAFMQGIAEGRKGKGSIFVWASGNGGRDHDNCNCDGYTNAPWTLSVSSATENGLIPWYSEACSSTLATTYSSGSSGERKVITTDLHNACTSSHTGTSASAPLAAGIIALTLHVNPELNWRDVQHLTVRCAHVANLRATDWAVNGVGRNYSHSFGYGVMDATCMVRLARNWKTVPEHFHCARQPSQSRLDLIIPGKSLRKTAMEVKDCDGIAFLEHVQAHITLSASKRGDVLLFLVSPQGTRTNLIAKRPRDYSRAGFKDWPFLTVHMWEESPIGTWTLEIQNDGRSIVELKTWSIAFHGTKEQPQPEQEATPTPAPPAPSSKEKAAPIAQKKLDQSHEKQLQEPEQNTVDVSSSSVVLPSSSSVVSSSSSASASSQPSKKELHQSSSSFLMDNCEQQRTSDWCAVCRRGFVQHNGRCVQNCPKEGYYEGRINHREACIPCYYSCQTCSGPNDYECLSCFGDAKLEEESPTQRYCYNKSLVNRVFSSSRWYYVLTIGFLVNFFIIVVLVIYIMRWRRDRKLLGVSGAGGGVHLANGSSSILPRSSLGGAGGVNGNAGGTAHNARYSPVKLTSGVRMKNSESAVPFKDYESSSEDEQLFRKPYSDDVKT